ncbi:hypothetical protein B4589_006195 [Halolamina sp. CBA1230]|uniref:hypothetical protein n=1 Tax=Halolamina sp. CBA1230 TaxID=1853690 RepID=UPI0009A210EA|nr:hypothetical protein [Halolamina sp. CBA1230]QKY19988.1 hypothetical protein B4589_006195 [Halolamina sp. CBA1230]
MVGEFRTKDGRCIVAEDRLRLQIGERGPLGTLREALTDGSIPPVRRAGVALFVLAVVVGAALAVRTLPPWLAGAGAGLLLAWLAWSRLRGEQAEKEVVIQYDAVESVEPQYGLPLLTRPRFVIRYRSEGGVKQRYVLCPSRLYGFGAYEHGKELFGERGLLRDEVPNEE